MHQANVLFDSSVMRECVDFGEDISVNMAHSPPEGELDEKKSSSYGTKISFFLLYSSSIGLLTRSILMAI